MTKDFAFVFKVMKRVVTDNGVKLFRQRRRLDVLREEATAQRRLMIHVIRNALNTIARHSDELVANVYSRHVITETREVLAQPAGTATDVENPGAGWQRQCGGHVREICEVAMGLRVHAVAKVFVGLVGEIIEGFGAQIMAPLGIEQLWILERRTFVVDACEFW